MSAWQATSNPRIKKYVDARSGKPRYLARYRKPDGRQSMKRGFTTKRAAEQWLNETEAAKRTGTFVSITDSKTRLADLKDRYFTIKASQVKPTTLADARTAWRLHVNPAFGTWQVGAIRTSDVELWAASLQGSATLVRRAHGILAGMLDLAVKDRLIAANPARGIHLPRPAWTMRHRYLTHKEVARVAKETGRHETLIYLLAYGGPRWGEAVALTPRDIDGRRVNIERSVTRLRGEWVVSTPKNHARRETWVPQFVADMLARQAEGKKPGELLFTNTHGGYLRPPSKSGGSPSNRWWALALERAGVEYLRPHDLRHTAASLAVQAGANVKLVQRMLGHASAAMTLDVYSDLFEDDLVTVADALDVARAAELNTF